MTSALEMSVKFGISVEKATEICDYLGVDLSADPFDADKDFATVAQSVRRNRASAYALAYVAAFADPEQRDFILDLDADFADRFDALDTPITNGELLPDARDTVRKLNNAPAGEYQIEWRDFVSWVKSTIERAGVPVEHYYLAVRLILSFPESHMRSAPRPIASILNKARHRGYLDGWFSTVERGGKNVVIYAAPGTPSAPDIDLSQDEINSFVRRLGSNDINKLAGFIGYEKNLKFESVKAFLQSREKPRFDL